MSRVGGRGGESGGFLFVIRVLFMEVPAKDSRLEVGVWAIGLMKLVMTGRLMNQIKFSNEGHLVHGLSRDLV